MNSFLSTLVAPPARVALLCLLLLSPLGWANGRTEEAARLLPQLRPVSKLPVVELRTVSKLPVVELRIAGHALRAELALRPEEQQRGLMYRTRLPADHGMLFVWPKARRICMWMKNTFLPLSVAFIDAQARIVSIQKMAPLTEEQHCAPSPVAYALEMPQGWFADADIRVDDRVEGLLDKRSDSVSWP